MKQPHLICIDLDGTLLGGTGFRPPSENLHAICDARRLGHKVFINTGRSWANIPQDLREVMDCFDGFSCANGSYIRTPEKVLRNVTFPADVQSDALRYFLTEDSRFCLFESEQFVLQTQAYSELYGSPGIRIFSPDEIHTRFNDCQCNVISCEGKPTNAFLRRFSSRVNIFQCDVFSDCTPLGCSKAIGMQYAAEICGIPMTHTVAIGDSANDLPMLQSAAISVAMQNAAEDIREQVDYVTDSNNNCGVAQIIRRLFLSD